jgi:hypothetical protein
MCSDCRTGDGDYAVLFTLPELSMANPISTSAPPEYTTSKGGRYKDGTKSNQAVRESYTSTICDENQTPFQTRQPTKQGNTCRFGSFSPGS